MGSQTSYFSWHEKNINKPINIEKVTFKLFKKSIRG